MLRLYQSDKLEFLAELLTADNTPPASPFEPEIIVVQSLGMGRWLSLRLADKLGICANVRFQLPASFVWDLLRKFLGELPKRSAFSAEVLTFRILDWLGRPENLDRTPRILGYLRNGDELRRFQLAKRIADLFDQYLIYRMDWIDAWERGEPLGLGGDEDWQALLWRDLASAESTPHRARYMSELRAALESDSAADRLPRRIAVFGVSSLPPAFLEILNAIAGHAEVNLYAINPCREYWGEIRDEREIGRLAGERLPEDLYLEVGHPLLASLGKQGREFFDQLAEHSELHSLFRAEPPRDSILHILQADILELIDRRSAGILPIRPDDRSLQVHACHSPMREIEVLRDQLLALFDADPELKPSDVAVLTPDIEQYTPYIEAVFAESRDAPAIPFSIADRGLTHEQPLLETFLALLDLPESRFAADTTLGYLEQAAIQRRFRLCENDLPIIHHWARAVGTRWGRDGAHKTEYRLPDIPRHTWRDGLKRLMLGYALPLELAGNGFPMFAETLPYDDIEGSRVLVLERFADFLETLFEWADRFKAKQPVTEWVEQLNAFIGRLFDPRDKDESVLLQLRATLDLLRELSEQAGFGEPVGIRVVKRWLTDRLSQPSSTGGFLTGAVTFCAMVPMRSLPFKVIAVLGLNHDSFPRQRHPPDFDLMVRHPRRGDRSRRLDDRYLFLETLLSAREVLYLSYVGRSVRDNAELPPSPLVSELIDVAIQSCESTEGDISRHLVTEHPLQPFDPGYFKDDRRLPGFSSTWLAAARLIGHGDKEPAPLFSGPLPEPEDERRTVDPESFAYFFSNPVRYLLRRRLNLALEDAAAEFEVREPFALDYRTRNQVRQNLLNALAADREPHSALLLADAQGLLPHGRFGEALHGREQRLVESFAVKLLPELVKPRLEPLPVDFEANGLRLLGSLAEVGAGGLTDYSFEEPGPRQIFDLWLRHLMLCLIAPAGATPQSLLHTPKQTITFQAVDRPENELAKLLNAYWRGLSEPLPFFPKTSYAYARYRLDPPARAGSDPETIRLNALKQARSIWEGSEFQSGESVNSYYQTVYRGSNPLDERFEALAVELISPILASMTKEPSR
ncbi:Exodeoxyribonuclease V subunit gamma [Methylocaldum marinum]|uniref:RecBCD enzyme subunit RecC n=1 Tax=Methylocaldum marinum TaxID=1432792 RepID=A0A250KS06_9GAMM|nr:exodeoxyribonuclease V subunit gamma [Methylocaldum marinum]BBA34352.1 Exodeoxyribonuclease V subunit gamma [Methylocaldum marinum]